MSQKKIIIATDIILEHLYGERRPSVLRVAMGRFFCYTTVFTAIELFALAKGTRERRAADNAMGVMKILGLNPKNAPVYGALFRKSRNRRALDLLVAGLCVECGLPLLTGRPKAFRGIRGLRLANPGDILGRR